MREAHHFTGLFPGDYFVHRFDFGGQIVIAYGLVRRIGADGQYHVDYQAQQPPFQPVTIQNDAHRVIGRISKRAYRLAQMRHWPNSESGVIAITRFFPIRFSSHLKKMYLKTRYRFSSCVRCLIMVSGMRAKMRLTLGCSETASPG